MFLRILKKLTKIAEYFYKILQMLLIFLNFGTSNVPNNKPRKMSTSRGSCLSACQTNSWLKKVLNDSLVVQFIRLESVRLTYVFGSVNGNILNKKRFEQQRKRYSKLILLFSLMGQALIAHILSLQDVTIRSMFCALFFQIVCW